MAALSLAGIAPAGKARLHVAFDRLLSGTGAPAWHITAVAEGPDTTVVQARGWDPVISNGEQLVKQVTELLADRYRVVVCAEGRGTADRMLRSFAEAGLAVVDATDAGAGDLVRPGAHLTIAPLERGFILPGIKLCRIAPDASFLHCRPGKAIPAHTHEGLEAVLVLQGGFHDATGHYVTGDIAVADDTIGHRPIADRGADCVISLLTSMRIPSSGMTFCRA